MFTILRKWGLAGAVTGVFLVPAAAQAPPEPAVCPAAPLSIYFASGDVTASPQAEVLMVRIGETAATCHADRIDLIAHIDAAVDGDRAVAVALERLTKVAGELVALGFPTERIRVAARAPEQGERVVGPNQIDVVIRKTGAPSPEAPPPGQTVRAAPSQSI